MMTMSAVRLSGFVFFREFSLFLSLFDSGIHSRLTPTDRTIVQFFSPWILADIPYYKRIPDLSIARVTSRITMLEFILEERARLLFRSLIRFFSRLSSTTGDLCGNLDNCNVTR